MDSQEMAQTGFYSDSLPERKEARKRREQGKEGGREREPLEFCVASMY